MIKRKQKLNKILAISAAILFAVFSFFAFPVPQMAIGKEEIRASADEIPEGTTIYPTDNLYTGPDVFIYYSNVGNDNPTSRFVISDSSLISAMVLAGGVSASHNFIFSSSQNGLNAYLGIVVYYVDGTTFGVSTSRSNTELNDQQFYRSVVLSSFEDKDILKIEFRFSDYSRNYYNYFRSTEMMINIGTTVYPYRPSNKALGDKFYNDGYLSASDDLSLGVLKGATLSGELEYTNGEKLSITNVSPTFTYNAIDFKPFLSDYYNYNGDNDNLIETADITINFAHSFIYNSFPVRFYGSNDVYGGYFIGTDGKRYTCQRNVSEQYSVFTVPDGSYSPDLQIISLSIHFGRAVDTLNGCLFVFSDGFQNGYSNGYNEGYAEGKGDGNAEGYSRGKQDGLSLGYSNGYNEAMLLIENSSFADLLFSVVDTPIKAFSSLFNFEILGVNMRGFVLSILTLALLVVVLRWIFGKV